MLACDAPREFAGIIPEFCLSEAIWRDPGTGDASCTLALGSALLGEEQRVWADFTAPATWRGDFWSSWFLAADARGSQYDLLRKRATDFERSGGHVVCLALRGSGFHGQDNRNWTVEEGNLHLSLGLQCDLPAAETGVALTMLPAVAVMDVLDAWGLPNRGGARWGIKWVNDIVAAGGKLGGVLTSARSQDGRLRSAVLGVGLNVLAAPAVAPTPFTPAVTCLADHLPPDRVALGPVAAAVLRAVARRFEELEAEGPGPLLEAYRRDSLVLGRQVTVRAAGPNEAGARRGKVLEIRSDLSLVLSDDPHPVTTGRLILEPDQLS